MLHGKHASAHNIMSICLYALLLLIHSVEWRATQTVPFPVFVSMMDRCGSLVRYRGYCVLLAGSHRTVWLACASVCVDCHPLFAPGRCIFDETTPAREWVANEYFVAQPPSRASTTSLVCRNRHRVGPLERLNQTPTGVSSSHTPI